MKYFKYLGYLLRHKWYVGVECFKRGLYWRGLVHDTSKLLPSELIPYTNFFYKQQGSDIKKGRDETGYYKPTDTGDAAFDYAWFLHQKRNKHHWQWWTLPQDEDGLKILEIPYPYNIEMICDWLGAGKAQGFFSPPDDPYQNTRTWYRKNGSKMRLHPNTRKWIEEYIGYTG